MSTTPTNMVLSKSKNSKEGLVFFHFKSDDNPNSCVVSVGFKIVDGKTIHLRCARCRPPDIWNRKIAREIIEGRFKKYGPQEVIDLDYFDGESIYEGLESLFHPDFGVRIDDWEAESTLMKLERKSKRKDIP